MVNKCCVPGCKSNNVSLNKNVPHVRVTMFRFPKNEKLKEEWLRKIPREVAITNNTVVCIKHFHEDDILLHKLQRKKDAPDIKVSLTTDSNLAYVPRWFQ